VDTVAELKITPLAAKMAADKGVDLTRFSGFDRKIRKDDILSARMERDEYYTDLKRIVANRMIESKSLAPHFYLTVDIDMSAVMAHRKQLKAAEAVEPVPSVNDYLIFATAKALAKHEMLNAEVRGGKIHVYADVNVGFAAASDKGLLVPVVRRTDLLSVTGVAGITRDLIKRIRSGKFTPDDLEGGTFTVSNLGMFGIRQFAPIINPPQAAILGFGAAKDQVVAMDGAIAIRPVMSATLSIDHRIADGAYGAQFLQTMTEILESGAF
jgi:pyruvate dehydrogenase E2 component (dihydrolipoamide acetyltransferase)